ncbi:membrane protein insertion efficiency factor YidD [bacterium]|nr:membrane protein insertion efficiency factor YidD [bacterium]
MLCQALIGLIRLYQRCSRLLPGVCRFRPTCSEYMIQALQVHGVVRGLGLGLWRIMRCNPFVPGGDDPVPPRRHAETNSPTE